ncbi:MAG: hypothetical protein Ct9H90mP30_1950 [Actinomycetota bacterium]|nr:MAG: hypothetical protein Ct9H90mP30_1950 [Actinomycetota bacterium]
MEICLGGAFILIITVNRLITTTVLGQYLTTIRAEDPLVDGDHEITIDYQHDGGFGSGGLATL